MYGRDTVYLHELLNNPEVRPLIDKALSTYPLYEKRSKEEHIPSIVPTREQLNKKLLDRYKYRQIGFETVGRFLDELEISMNEIMPYYNQLLFSLDQDYNILYNVDYTRDVTTNRDGSSTKETNGSEEVTNSSNAHSEGTSTNNSNVSDTSETSSEQDSYTKHVKSTTPQSLLTITNKGINSVEYADEVDFNHDTNTQTGSASGSSISEGTSTTSSDGNTTSESNTTNSITSNDTNTQEEVTKERVLGNYGQVSAQSLIDRYRDLIINIEQKIINDRRITELFMLIYD